MICNFQIVALTVSNNEKDQQILAMQTSDATQQVSIDLYRVSCIVVV